MTKRHSETTSEELRDELALIAPRRECDRLAELSALLHVAGTLHFRGRGEVTAHLDLASASAARRAFALLRSFDITSEIRTYRRRAFGRETRYQLHVEGDRALQTLHEAGVVTARLAPQERPPKRVIGRACCRGAYLRGALLGAGSLSGPRSPHLELRTSSEAGVQLIVELAGAEGVRLAIVRRDDHWAAYAKGRDAIEGLLAVAGASDAALRLEERAVVGETKSRANRLANADHANLVRAGRAAHNQVLAARALRDTGRLETLSPELREVAELRLRNPSLSLRELGLKCRPPATKATAHRRLRTIVRLSGGG